MYTLLYCKVKFNKHKALTYNYLCRFIYNVITSDKISTVEKTQHFNGDEIM